MNTALLFPGQGSQEAGMGRDLAEQSADAMNLWKRAERISGLPLREIFWEGSEADMADTRALQPALTVVNISLWAAVAGRVKPCAAAGHSLGEFSALAAAQALPVDDVLEITALRGRLMAEADPHGMGAMAAIVKLAQSDVEDMVRQSAETTDRPLIIANYNTPAQLVVSGAKEAVEHAAGLAKERRGRAVMLKVSGAFHSPLMAEAARELEPLLRRADWSRPRFPVYCNVDGRPAHEAGEALDALVRQMTSSVRWVDTMRRQHVDGVTAWLEIGPKTVLGKMVAPCLAGLLPEGGTPAVFSVRNAAEAEALAL